MENKLYYDVSPEKYNRFRELIACKQLIKYPTSESWKLINFLHSLELTYQIVPDMIIFLNLNIEQKKWINTYCNHHGLKYTCEIKWNEDNKGEAYYNGELNYITFKE